ncbi:MAG: ABC transporter ATP-binding protein [Dehalococcoidales bacterium]|jgi:heme exporter protein A|nr:ABC transporter ATP-binding protein [Dehalococcoidales bacterium]MDP7416212.1 ABC transporter ATP-binding protein [Dehalococcoidales bacterium]
MAMDNGDTGSTFQDQVIEIQGLTKAFGHHLALRGLDLKIRQGEKVAILGPNGAGKTTLIKVLATIINITSGKVLITGLNPKDNAEEIRRQIGVITHQTFLYGNLTANENLEFYGRMYDIPQRKKRINEVADMVRMTPRLYDRVNTLSRGMQQRIAIARALLHKPTILLLDEPETGLDPQATSILWEILNVEREDKRTIFLTTHSLERGLEIGNRLLILNQGKFAYEESGQTLSLADLKQIYQHYSGIEV